VPVISRRSCLRRRDFASAQRLDVIAMAPTTPRHRERKPFYRIVMFRTTTGGRWRDESDPSTPIALSRKNGSGISPS